MSYVYLVSWSIIISGSIISQSLVIIISQSVISQQK